jgi:hypothetical protein
MTPAISACFKRFKQPVTVQPVFLQSTMQKFRPRKTREEKQYWESIVPLCLSTSPANYLHDTLFKSP